MSSRKDFEMWFAEYVKDWPQPSEAIQKIASDLYWSVWQASRAAVVVELPDVRWGDPYSSGWNDMHGEALKAIEAAGLKVNS